MTFKEFIKEDEKFQENWWSWHAEPSKHELKDRKNKIQNFKLNQLKDKEFAKKLANEYDLNPNLAHYIAEYISSKRNKDIENSADLSSFLSNEKMGAGLKFLKISKEIDYYLNNII